MSRPDPSRYEKRWRRWRFLYYGVLGLIFSAFAFYFGPNLMMFGKLSWITAEDFAKEVGDEPVRTVRAIKEYQRDHGGKLPERIDDLVPGYLRERPFGNLWEGQFHDYTSYGHTIIYRFTPDDEGWEVSGPFVRDRLPLPTVQLNASTQPATQPD